jgi:ubiquinone biosynthesis protein
MRDLAKTAMILARYGPQLPRLAEEALIRLNNPPPPPKPQRRIARLSWMALGGVLVGGAVWIAGML